MGNEAASTPTAPHPPATEPEAARLPAWLAPLVYGLATVVVTWPLAIAPHLLMVDGRFQWGQVWGTGLVTQAQGPELSAHVRTHAHITHARAGGAAAARRGPCPQS